MGSEKSCACGVITSVTDGSIKGVAGGWFVCQGTNCVPACSRFKSVESCRCDLKLTLSQNRILRLFGWAVGQGSSERL
jgi:hypothetical protein